MGSSSIPSREAPRRLIRWAQSGRCLLCPLPYALDGRLHWLIPRELGGLGDPLNLFGLCPNHRAAVETGRDPVRLRKRHPREVMEARCKAALELHTMLDDEGRRLFDALSDPHPFRAAIEEGVSPHKRRLLASGIARAEAETLLTVNRARPRMLVALMVSLGRMDEPGRDDDDLNSLEAEAKERVRLADLGEIMDRRLTAMDLPFDPAWLEGTS